MLRVYLNFFNFSINSNSFSVNKDPIPSLFWWSLLAYKKASDLCLDILVVDPMFAFGSFSRWISNFVNAPSSLSLIND